MAAQDSANYADVAQKNDQVDEKLAQEDQALAALEADLQAAEARVEAAETRYRRARVSAERALSTGDAEAGGSGGGPAGGAVAGEEELIRQDLKADKDPSHRDTTHTSKNAGARTDKEVSHSRWVAARAAEGRVRDRAVKARDRLRRGARDRKFQWYEPEQPAEAAAAGESKKEESSEPAPAPKPKAVEETPAVKEGANGIAERLNCLKDRPNPAEKRSALVRVVTGGKDNYYTFEPQDVVKDLQARGLVEEGVATELLGLLADAPAAKPAEVPAEGWAAGAQKASGIARLDDKPFKDDEFAYLRHVEERGLLAAEAELDAAEKSLGALISQAEERYGQLGEEDATEPPLGRPSPTGEVKVDEDEADRLEEYYDPDGHRESRGSKNTSALNPKVVSREKWENARGKESRDREHQVMAREARRSEARDIKHESGDVA